MLGGSRPGGYKRQLMARGGEAVIISDGTYGIRVDPRTGLRAGGANVSTPDFTVSPRLATMSALSETGGLILAGNSAAPATWTASPTAVTAGTFSPVAYWSTRSPSRNPVEASNGTDFLVVWTSGTGANERVPATRVDGATGAYLDDLLLELGRGMEPVVAGAGSNDMVVWL